MQLRRPDPERRRRRLRLLAELADAAPQRDRAPRRARGQAGRIRDLIASRRRLFNLF